MAASHGVAAVLRLIDPSSTRGTAGRSIDLSGSRRFETGKHSVNDDPTGHGATEDRDLEADTTRLPNIVYGGSTLG